MTQLNFGIRIGARDDSQGALRGALSGFRSFARTISKPIVIPIRIGRRGLALARDINLGLAPIVRGLDRIIERGTGLEVVRKSFESLTGKGSQQAGMLARRLVQAASGTIRLAKAMQIANRAMGSGISFDQLLVAMDFISKKSITTGKNAEQAIEKVITGLSRGSTLFLDDFGILVDGIDGVKRAFNSIKGAGAWESLGPAAQKAETIRQAIVEMRGQMGRLGVSGKETVFTFQAIKNQIGDAVDKLFMAIGKSRALKNALQGIRDVIGGMMKHFGEGGSLMDVLFGKQGGKSGGLFGFLKAGVLDLGEALGRGILGGTLVGLSELPGLFKAGWEAIRPKILGLWDELKTRITAALQPLVDALTSLRGWLGDRLGGAATTQPATTQPTTTRPTTTRPAARRGRAAKAAAGVAENMLGVAINDAALQIGARGAASSAKQGLRIIDEASAMTGGAAAMGLKEKLGRGLLKFIAKRAVPVATVADFAWTSGGFLKELYGLFKALGEMKAAQKMFDDVRKRAGIKKPTQDQELGGHLPSSGIWGMSAGLGAILLGQVGADKPKNLFDLFGMKGRSLIGGGVLGGDSRARGWAKAFIGEFPPPKAVRAPLQLKTDTSGLALSERGLVMRRQRMALLRRDIRRTEGQARRDARRRAGEFARRKRREGFVVTEEDQAGFERDFRRQLIAERTGAQRKGIAGIQRELMKGSKDYQDLVRFVDKITTAATEMKESVEEGNANIQTLVSWIGQAIRELVGVNRRLEAAH
jgi:hypothetical protein